MFGKKTQLQPVIFFGGAGETHNHRHNHQTTIHEHRAPTDDSIRLAQEMEEKVRAQILGSIPIENFKMDNRLLVNRVNMPVIGVEIVLIVKIDQEARFIKHIVEDMELNRGEEFWFPRFRQKVADSLTSIFLSDVFDKAPQHILSILQPRKSPIG